MSSELLIIMARHPTHGKVKTRLAAEIGHAAATELYRSFLKHFANEFAEASFDVEWRYTPARAPFRRFVAAVYDRRVGRAHSRTALIERRYSFRPQPPGNLGERMQRIFTESFARGYNRVVMIGTDAPEVGQRTVRRTLRLLRDHQAVFQPTFDGGYALIGLSAPLDVFSKISWSTDRVMAQTRRRLRRLRTPFAELPPTFDVDTAEDLKRLVTGPARRGCSSSGR